MLFISYCRDFANRDRTKEIHKAGSPRNIRGVVDFLLCCLSKAEVVDAYRPGREFDVVRTTPNVARHSIQTSQPAHTTLTTR